MFRRDAEADDIGGRGVPIAGQGEGSDARHFLSRPASEVLDEGFQTPLLSGRFGYAVHAAGHRTQAEEVFLKAITYDKDRAEILCLYGLFLAETDRVVEARAVWERARATDPPEDIRRRLDGLLTCSHPDDTKGRK